MEVHPRGGRPSERPTDGARRLPRRAGPPWWRELVLVAALYLGYTLARSLDHGAVARADRDGWAILMFERARNIAPENWLNAHLETMPLLAVAACYVYAALHYLVTPSVLIWAYWRDPRLYVRARTTLVLTTFGALLGFWLYPTAPPRLLSGAGFQDTLQRFSGWGWWGAGSSLPSGSGSLANQFAAMPSLHVAWSVWCSATLLALVRRRSVKLVGVAYPIVTAVVVLATGNHYLLDVVAGVAVWAGAELCTRRFVWAVRPALSAVGGRSAG